ncbi:MAG: PAS domain-containing protein, partial [Verrucomicrobiota bacterium]
MNQNTSPHPFKGPDSTELFNFLLNNIPDLIYFKDLESRFICVNDALIKLLGLKEAGEVIGISDFDYMAPEEARRTFMDEQQVIRTGEPIRGHITRKVHPDGSLLWVLTTKLPLRNAKGEIIGTCGISKDVTSLKETEDALARSNGELERALAELKAAQRQLIHAEKSQLTARLAAGIAHEVRNPLNILNTGLEFISSEKSVADNPTISMVLQEMRDAIRRADNVISTLMDASRPEGLELEATDMNAMIGSLVAEMSGKLESAGVHASLQLAPDLPFIHTDKKKIRQVINGLVSNAVEAMPNGGELQISTRVHRLTPDDITR